MAFPARICLLALCLVLVPVVGAQARPASRLLTAPSVHDPVRLPGSVPLTPQPAPRRALPPLGQRAVGIAAREFGTSYRYGGSAPGGFDCSGLVAYVDGTLGVALPHDAAAQYRYGRPVDRAHLRPGDLVFFEGLGDVGRSIGHGRMIHAPRTGERVEIASLAAGSGSFEGARRIASWRRAAAERHPARPNGVSSGRRRLAPSGARGRVSLVSSPDAEQPGSRSAGGPSAPARAQPVPTGGREARAACRSLPRR